MWRGRWDWTNPNLQLSARATLSVRHLLLLQGDLSQHVHHLKDYKFFKKASEEGCVLPLKLLFPLRRSSQ